MRYLKNYQVFESSNDSIRSISYDSFTFNQIINNHDGLEERLRFFRYPDRPTKNVYYSILFDSEEIIGICKIAKYSDLKDNQMGISYCSIDRNYRGKGYLNILIKEVMELCRKKGFSLGASRWTVPGFLKLRPTVLKWSSNIGVEFRDHELKFDNTHTYNSNLVNVNEMTPEELEEFQKLSRLKPKFNGIWKRIFYDTGIYQIYSTQTEYDKNKIDEIFKDIKEEKYRYFSNDGTIAGYIHKDKYYITEGHHRILAALKYWRLYNDYKPVDNMIQNGKFEIVKNKPQGNRRFPSKMMERIVNDNDVTELIQKVKSNPRVYSCGTFAEKFIEELGGESEETFILTSTNFDDEEGHSLDYKDINNKRYYKNFGILPNGLTTDKLNLADHAWVYHNGKHYDHLSEEGVENFMDLKWFKLHLDEIISNPF